jgi:carboxypeptidase Q
VLLALLLLTPFPQDVAQRLAGGALGNGVAYSRLRELTDSIGPRLSGSAGAEAAVQWALQIMKADGLSARLEAVKVPHWERGDEHGEILPARGVAGARLALTALGGSVAGDVTAEVVEAGSLEELQALGERARGKLVFFNHSMQTPAGYGQFVGMRSHGPAAAGKLGAAGVLLRSLATASLRSPHTGMTSYDEGAPRIPAAAISVEDAEHLHRLLARGPVRVHLALGCRWLPDADSANVVADVRGRERPDEVVLLGAHLDSWDLGQGANDDGAGVVMVMEAGRLIAALKPPPRRTVRIVLFMNEENGLAGGKGYAAAHAGELSKHVAAMESDSGAAKPLGVVLHAGAGGEALLSPWLTPLQTVLGIAMSSEGEAGGADLTPLAAATVPMAGIRIDGTHYFDIHHSAADTFDKIDPQGLAQDTAAYALLAYALAEMPETLPRPAPPPPAKQEASKHEALKAH